MRVLFSIQFGAQNEVIDYLKTKPHVNACYVGFSRKLNLEKWERQRCSELSLRQISSLQTISMPSFIDNLFITNRCNALIKSHLTGVEKQAVTAANLKKDWIDKKAPNDKALNAAN